MTDTLSRKNNLPTVILISGQTIAVRSIKLYEARLVNEINGLRASAVQAMGNVSTGVSFWGSPGWALGGAAALSVFEGLLTSASRKKGMETLRTAQIKHDQMVNGAHFFEAESILGTHSPYPQAWSATYNFVDYIDVTNLGWLARKDLLWKHNKTDTNIVNIDGSSRLEITSEKQFIHDGDDFVHVITDTELVSVRWAHVAAYLPPRRQQ